MTESRKIESRTLEKLIVPRFIKYTEYDTQSDRHAEGTPTTEGQWALARLLKDELSALGLKDVKLTNHCYVIARLPPTAGRENAPAIGFLAHLDTAGDVSGKNVKARLVENYDGKKIELSGGLCLDPEKEPDLAAQKGSSIIHADGSTLLGADDKAGIAEIMGAAEYLLSHSEIPRGPVEIIFTPDEETGRGLPEFPAGEIKSEACYTLDGGGLGGIEVECFNAWKANIKFEGKAIHIGAARGILANAALMAASFALMLPRSESPESTDGYFGYYCPMEISGALESARLEVFLRDFETEGIKRRLAALDSFAKATEAQFPGGKVAIAAAPQYYNMKEKIDQNPQALRLLLRALENAGVKSRLHPIRGGTDGARLTDMGIPTPNIFTGGRNYHSRLEWASVQDMTAACKVIIELVSLWSE